MTRNVKKFGILTALTAAALIAAPPSAYSAQREHSKSVSRGGAVRSAPAMRSAPARSAPSMRTAPSMRSAPSKSYSSRSMSQPRVNAMQSRSTSAPSQRYSSPRSVPVARPQTVKSQPTYATRPQPSARSAPTYRSPANATREMSRTPLSRVDPQTSVTPRKSGPGINYGSSSVGDRRWPGAAGPSTGYRGGDRYGSWYGDRYGRYGDRYGRAPYGGYGYRYPYHGYRYPYYRFPYYSRYGYYRPYYYSPYYVHAYPYFVPTFGLSFTYFDTPYYYSEPAVVYTEPSTVVYAQPQTYYAESGTTYVETQPAPSTTYVERQYEVQQAPSTAPAVEAAPSQQEQQPAKQPDQRVLAAVGQGNEHFGAGRYAEARNAYGEAMAIEPTDGVARLLFGLASFAQGDFSTAAGSVRQALDTTPDLIWYPFNIKALYRNDAKFQEHVAALAGNVDAAPGNTENQFLLGYMWYASGDAVSAKTIFGALATNNPSEQLYLALRDASTQALESMTKQGQQASPGGPAPQPNP